MNTTTNTNTEPRLVPAEDLTPGDRVEIPTDPPMRFVVKRVEIVVGEGGNDEADILAMDGMIWRSKTYDCWRVLPAS